MIRWTEEQIAEAYALSAAGHDQAFIARAVGKTRGAVGNLFYRARQRGIVEHHKRPWAEADTEALLRLRAAGATLAKIQQAFPDRTLSAVKNKLSEHDRRAACVPYQRPAWRRNDDAKHLRLIAEAMQRGEHLPRQQLLLGDAA